MAEEIIQKVYYLDNYATDLTTNATIKKVSAMAVIVQKDPILSNFFIATYSSETTVLTGKRESPWKDVSIIFSHYNTYGNIYFRVSVTNAGQENVRWSNLSAPSFFRYTTLSDGGMAWYFDEFLEIIFTKIKIENILYPCLLWTANGLLKYSISGATDQLSPNPVQLYPINSDKWQMDSNNPDCYNGDNIGLSSVVTVHPFDYGAATLPALYYYDGGTLFSQGSSVRIKNSKFLVLISNIIFKIGDAEEDN